MKNIGVLWKKKGKEGRQFLSGVIDNGIYGDVQVMIFPNDKKDAQSKAPDYRIVMLKDDPQETRDTGPQDDFIDGPAPEDEPVEEMQF